MNRELFDEEYILLEIERIKLLFEENNYDSDDMIKFIDMKYEIAKKNDDKVNLEICERLKKEISK